MADSLIITRGLQIPDCNFLEPIGDAWSVHGDLIEDDCTFNFSTEGAGRELEIDCTGLSWDSPYDYLESSMTPFGVAAGPFKSSPGTTRWHFACIAKVSNIGEGNSTDLLDMRLRGYDDDGVALGWQGNAEMSITNGTSWALYSAIGADTINTSTRRYKMELFLRDSSPSGAHLHLAWVGVGISHNSSDPYTDALSTGYQPGFNDELTSRMKQLTPDGGIAPVINLPDGGTPSGRYLLSLANLTTEDKALIRRAEFWFKGGRSDDILAVGQTPLNRGTSQPVLVLLNRETVKLAMYAKFAGSVVFTQSTGGASPWWPDTGARWATSLPLREWLF